ncbi:MAG: tyrosine-type recombinase/integrase [Planctomycetes bacterium]|nr:tyrosine-type recombinase/integrase [Planctomycetota bacterium]
MSDSTPARSDRKPDRPKKPYPAFPLTPHASGAWQKKIRGKVHYFGKWAKRVKGKLERIEGDGWEDALKAYKVQADDLHAGRTPRLKNDGLTLADLCNRFLTSKTRKREAGELGVRIFQDYKEVTDLLIATFGANRLVDDLAADDFGTLRAKMAKKWGPVRLGNTVTRCKSVFKYGIDNGLIERAVRFGTEFKKPGKTVMRLHRAKGGERMLEAEQVRALIEGAMMPGGDAGPALVKPTPTMKAMILLGVNCGFGNADCALLPLSAINLDEGWIVFPRPKTGVARRCPLWPETVDAIRTATGEKVRPKPASYAECGLAFMTSKGTPWIRVREENRTDMITMRFKELLEAQGVYRDGISFYTLRHVFRTVADAARDPVAIDTIMGHADNSMGAVYRERIDDARLRAVTDYVRGWLWPAMTQPKTTPTTMTGPTAKPNEEHGSN